MNTILTNEKLEQSLLSQFGKKNKKKYLFETVCDKSFNKALRKKVILIEDDSSNPENSTKFPHLYNQPNSDSNHHLNAVKLSPINLSKNSSLISSPDPFYKLQK